jgi:hypothetical protein
LFDGWYREVFAPAITTAGYSPELVVATSAPNSISDETLGHLAHDEMAVFDLGGIELSDLPNPNVMYELGIRHAFDLPAVIFINDPQKLPFDVSPQRAIVEPRDFASMTKTRQRLQAFMSAAKSGNFYQPMRAIRRAQRLTTESQGQHQLMKDIVEELADIKRQVKVVADQQAWPRVPATAQGFSPMLLNSEEIKALNALSAKYSQLLKRLPPIGSPLSREQTELLDEWTATTAKYHDLLNSIS